MAKTVKVCVRVPESGVDTIKTLAADLRAEADGTQPAGWDAKEISRIAREYFTSYAGMFGHHGWPEKGSDMMRKVQSRVKDEYGSIDAFVEKYPAK